jgi:hypothetical protein
MARSILPSTDRSVSRHRAGLHRASRRAVRLTLARIAGDPEVWDDDADVWESPQHDICAMARSRRYADKLNHFQRWATRVTEGLKPEDRLSRMRAVLPAGLIGEHAVQHLKTLPAFLTEHERMRRATWRKMAPSSWMDRGELAEVLRTILAAPDGHRLFNHALKKSVGEAETEKHVRTLLGLHDVRAFLRDTARSRLFHVVHWFCSAWKSTRDSRAAWLALFPGQRLLE